jgi:Replication-relaxation
MELLFRSGSGFAGFRIGVRCTMRCTEPRFPASYEAVHRYDGAVIHRGRRGELVPCAVQPRDLALVRDVRRYKFLTAPQLRELWWPQSSVQAADRRLLKLFRAGYLDRFRPLSRRGSFPWTYKLGLEGHRLLQRAGLVERRERFAPREVFDYGHVLHELQLNAWILAYRAEAGESFISWEGETHIEPPREARARQGVLGVGDYWSAEGLRDPRPRLVRPDAVLEVARNDGDGAYVLLIEYDRTRRVDKNYEKIRRYDAFLCWWWQHTSFADRGRPFVICRLPRRGPARPISERGGPGADGQTVASVSAGRRARVHRPGRPPVRQRGRCPLREPRSPTRDHAPARRSAAPSKRGRAASTAARASRPAQASRFGEAPAAAKAEPHQGARHPRR